MAYVPWQNWEPLYNEEQAFDTGTVFPSLDLPFCGRGPKK
ncbi:MAG: spore coat associated protein CotJA [Oscillospiraceae bacterium]|nr:spore coat associated protein CotJA [Oscillospiraceae bacterium]MBQ8338807.1 spore coat associated protein CotJA [Oscillospiraceae bacterium]MBQ8869025.1 spore coat associated protein CotJA [Oscillospiraceae bacterium]